MVKPASRYTKTEGRRYNLTLSPQVYISRKDIAPTPTYQLFLILFHHVYWRELDLRNPLPTQLSLYLHCHHADVTMACCVTVWSLLSFKAENACKQNYRLVAIQKQELDYVVNSNNDMEKRIFDLGAAENHKTSLHYTTLRNL